jgi:hypothetical protein
MKRFVERWLGIGRRAKGPPMQLSAICGCFLYFAMPYLAAVKELGDYDSHGYAGAMIPCW